MGSAAPPGTSPALVIAASVAALIAASIAAGCVLLVDTSGLGGGADDLGGDASRRDDSSLRDDAGSRSDGPLADGGCRVDGDCPQPSGACQHVRCNTDAHACLPAEVHGFEASTFTVASGTCDGIHRAHCMTVVGAHLFIIGANALYAYDTRSPNAAPVMITPPFQGPYEIAGAGEALWAVSSNLTQEQAYSGGSVSTTQVAVLAVTASQPPRAFASPTTFTAARRATTWSLTVEPTGALLLPMLASVGPAGGSPRFVHYRVSPGSGGGTPTFAPIEGAPIDEIPRTFVMSGNRRGASLADPNGAYCVDLTSGAPIATGANFFYQSFLLYRGSSDGSGATVLAQINGEAGMRDPTLNVAGSGQNAQTFVVQWVLESAAATLPAPPSPEFLWYPYELIGGNERTRSAGIQEAGPVQLAVPDATHALVVVPVGKGDPVYDKWQPSNPALNVLDPARLPSWVRLFEQRNGKSVLISTRGGRLETAATKVRLAPHPGTAIVYALEEKSFNVRTVHVYDTRCDAP